MANIIGSPERYVQGRGILGELCKHLQNIGKAPFILVSESGKGRVKEPIEKSAKEYNTKLSFEIFQGECSRNEIDRLVKVYKESGCDVVVGIGGGKIHDTAKALAFYAEAPVVIVPTIAGTDAPCSALSVIYTDDGAFEDYLFLPKNPNMVLVDTEVISSAPARLLVSGMGDALATYFEARAFHEIKIDEIMKVAELACSPNDTMGNMPLTLTPEIVCDAIIATDRLGHYFKAKRL
ncbi:MAG TPA: hypothetical protein DC053_02135 [Lachnoclostridium sp.]|nr:hypothetical protein [Lachnoclostridium sp.]